MPANTDAMIRAAADAVKNGKKSDARALLEKVLEVDERNEQAWMWMSGVVDNPEDQKLCLENVLAINPNNQQARQGLKALGGASTPPPAPAPAPSQATYTPAFDMNEADDFFSSMDFGSESSKPAEKPSWDAGIATSSASASYSGPETSGEDLDDWISGMGLATKPKATEPTPSTSYDSGGYDDFDDAFLRDDDKYATDDTPNETSSSFDDDFMSDFGAPFASETLNEEEFDSFNSPPPPAKPATRAYTPVPDFDEVISTPAKNEKLDDIFEKDFIGDIGSDTQSKRSAPENQKTPEELFALIPSDIPSGRLPGTDETVPSSLKVGIVVALVMNVLAFTLLLLRFVG
jgi:hypothetical protein